MMRVRSNVLRTCLGLSLVQLALPKLLPLPGVSSEWLLIILGGGFPGILASVVGGVLLLAWGIGWIEHDFEKVHLAWLSAFTAVVVRIFGIFVAYVAGVPVRWWPGEEPGTGVLLGMMVVALAYGTMTYLMVDVMRTASRPTHGKA